ncbi:MAG: hypothetical protein IKQ92_13050, partial [Clostridia bacterium]|nr:hypothetical protein [Clostridia bacterium]
GTPKTLKEFLFLVLFLLDKGEKVRLSDLKSKRAVAFLHGLGVNATVPFFVTANIERRNAVKRGLS